MDLNDTNLVRDLPGHEGRYKVSKCGKVFKFYREIRTNKKRGWHEVIPFPGSGNGPAYYGYYQVYLGKPDGTKGHAIAVHRLVAMAWIPPGREDQIEVNHKDNNSLNNHVDNLEWVTPTENAMHYHYEMNGRPRGVKNPTVVLTEDQVREIRAAEGTHKEIGARYGVKAPAIWKIKRRRTWAHLPD